MRIATVVFGPLVDGDEQWLVPVLFRFEHASFHRLKSSCAHQEMTSENSPVPQCEKTTANRKRRRIEATEHDVAPGKRKERKERRYSLRLAEKASFAALLPTAVTNPDITVTSLLSDCPQRGRRRLRRAIQLPDSPSSSSSTQDKVASTKNRTPQSTGGDWGVAQFCAWLQTRKSEVWTATEVGRWLWHILCANLQFGASNAHSGNVFIRNYLFDLAGPDVLFPNGRTLVCRVLAVPLRDRRCFLCQRVRLVTHYFDGHSLTDDQRRMAQIGPTCVRRLLHLLQLIQCVLGAYDWFQRNRTMVPPLQDIELLYHYRRVQQAATVYTPPPHRSSSVVQEEPQRVAHETAPSSEPTNEVRDDVKTLVRRRHIFVGWRRADDAPLPGTGLACDHAPINTYTYRFRMHEDDSIVVLTLPVPKGLFLPVSIVQLTERLPKHWFHSATVSDAPRQVVLQWHCHVTTLEQAKTHRWVGGLYSEDNPCHFWTDAWSDAILSPALLQSLVV